MITGPDVSHFQGTPNWAQVKTSGHDFCVLKATEGTTYLDPTLSANRKSAHAAGLIVGMYHFARAGDPAAEARWFLAKVGALLPGEFLVLDWEVAYSGDHVAWCRTWLDTVRTATGVAPLIYMNKAELTGRAWGPVASTYGLWLASYDNSTAAPASGAWLAAAMKQYSDKGTVPGVAGVCDVDVFYGTTAQLLAYGSGGANVTTIDMNSFLNNPAYYPAGKAGPTISEVLMHLDQFVAPVARGDAPGGWEEMRQEVADAHTQAQAAVAALAEQAKQIAALTTAVAQLSQAVAAAPGMTCQGNPKAVLSALGEAASNAASA